jgi:hypothetical protein
MSPHETIADARAARKPRKAKLRKARSRRAGVPPPVKFDLDALPDSAFLTSDEVAGIMRVSISTPRAWRQDKDHPLQWGYVNGKPSYTVRSMRKYIAHTSRGRADDDNSTSRTTHMTVVSSENLPEAMLQILRRFVDVVVNDIDVHVRLSPSEMRNLQAAYSAIQKCLDEAETSEGLVELTRMLVHNGLAGAYADQFDPMGWHCKKANAVMAGRADDG